MENGVGETSLEMASLQDLLARTQGLWRTNHFGFQVDSPMELSTYPGDTISTTPSRIDIEHLEAELPRMRKVIQELLADGRLREGSKLAVELDKFVTLMEGKLADAKTAPPLTKRRVPASGAPRVLRLLGAFIKPDPGEEEHPKESCDRTATLREVRLGLEGGAVQRQLVHLIDVQRSVQGGLVKHGGLPVQNVAEVFGGGRAANDELEPEESEETVERRESLVLQTVGVEPDQF